MTNVTLRPWEKEDAEALAMMANNSKIARNLRDVFPHPYTVENAHWFVEDCQQKEGRGQLCRAVLVDGKVAGCISVMQGQDVERRSAELGYWLGEPYWGQGVMTWAVKALCQEAFATMDIVRIFAEPFAPNLGSRKVLEKTGFILEGIKRKSICKEGEMMDSCLYTLLKEE
jgi:ribosomal-protein-alanine N-acetyltransferase